MPKLSELIPMMAETLGVPEKAVGVIARHARASGHLSSGGRGPGGAEMTTTDCTNLLLATMRCQIGGQAKDAGIIIGHYRSLIEAHKDDHKKSFDTSFPGCVADTFGKTIDNIINQYIANGWKNNDPVLCISIGLSAAEITLVDFSEIDSVINYRPDITSEEGFNVHFQAISNRLLTTATVNVDVPRQIAVFLSQEKTDDRPC